MGSLKLMTLGETPGETEAEHIAHVAIGIGDGLVYQIVEDFRGVHGGMLAERILEEKTERPAA